MIFNENTFTWQIFNSSYPNGNVLWPLPKAFHMSTIIKKNITTVNLFDPNKNKNSTEKNEINNRRRQTNLQLYGVENCFLRPDAKQKSAVSNSKGREFTLTSGKIIRVRGYEDKVLTILLSTYSEQELIIDDRLLEYNIPIFRYVNVNQHTALYYPDIYIPKENKIIEVKSRWWCDGHGSVNYKSRLTNNLKKRQAVLDQGFNYELWLFEDARNHKVLLNDSDI
jgi:hypothetical protein